MTRDELTAEVVAKVRGILARLKEMADAPVGIFRYPPSPELASWPAPIEGMATIGSALAAYEREAERLRAGGQTPLQAFLSNPPPIPGVTEMRQRMRGREENLPPITESERAQQERDANDALALPQEDPEWNVEFPRLPDLAAFLSRLLALLELAPAERDFVQAIAEANTTGGPVKAYPFLEIFADWLEDHGRTEEGQRIRRVSPQTGDVLVLEHPASWTTLPLMDELHELQRRLRQQLQETGRLVVVVSTPANVRLRMPDEREMFAAGWTRAADHEELWRELLAELKDQPEYHEALHNHGAVLAMIRRLKREAFQHDNLETARIGAAILAEREACARIVEQAPMQDSDGVCDFIRPWLADLIRNRPPL